MTCPRCSSAQITVIGKILRGTRTRTRYLCDDCYQRWDQTTAILSYALPNLLLSNRSTQRRLLRRLCPIGVLSARPSAFDTPGGSQKGRSKRGVPLYPFHKRSPKPLTVKSLTVRFRMAFFPMLYSWQTRWMVPWISCREQAC